MKKTAMTEIEKRMFKHNDYRRLMQIRAIDEEMMHHNKMIIEGLAICYDEPAILFNIEGLDYKEVIAKGALDKTDTSKTFLKYNHSDAIMAMARTKNGTLHIEQRDDGVYIRAELANTTAGKDLYELIKRGDVDKMSFAFTIKNEVYDSIKRTWTIYEIDTLYDVSAVTLPAYEQTEIFARRYDEAEVKRRKELESLESKRKVEIIRVRMKINQTGENTYEQKKSNYGNQQPNPRT
jgi:uncharacterized protein